jgi:hypothetical protein
MNERAPTASTEGCSGMAVMGRTPVLPEATPVRAFSDLLRRSPFGSR